MDGSEPLRAAVLGINLDSPDEDFDYALGAVYPGGEVAEGLSVEEIPAATWAVFPCKGEMPEAFEVLWKKIYTEFFPASEYQPADMCLEVYPGDDIKSPDFTCEFWLSVEKK